MTETTIERKVQSSIALLDENSIAWWTMRAEALVAPDWTLDAFTREHLPSYGSISDYGFIANDEDELAALEEEWEKRIKERRTKMRKRLNPDMLHTISYQLSVAVRRLESADWYRGSTQVHPLGTECALTAIPGVTAPDYMVRYLVERGLSNSLDPYVAIPEWNDRPEQTKENVLYHLRAAARQAHREGV